MIKKIERLEIVSPKNQLELFGYENYFNSFVKLYKKNKLPNTMLLSGPKGSGKATFAYHFINYILSNKEINKYSIESMTINPQSFSYKTLLNNTNPNFSLLNNDEADKNIKIDKVRHMLNFLNKSTYSSDIKIILIDNAEYLNTHSSNALLKVLEESNNRTFFFIIHNNHSKILDTIKSRSIEFKFFFTFSEKEKILKNIIKSYDIIFDLKTIDSSFYFDTPGNILRYLLIFKDSNLSPTNDKLECISYILDKYKNKNDTELLTTISFFVELFYKDLSVRNSKNYNIHSINKYKLLRQINDTKQFNLDKNNLFTSLINTLQNETK
jgi:DNA polymerase III subunit delta'